MKNNIKYKGNTNNTSVIILFFKSKVKNSKQWHFAWERGVFCDVGCHFLFFILLLYLNFIFVSSSCCCIFIHIFFLTSSLTLLWTIARFLHPFYTISPAHCRVICNNFIFNHSVIFLTQALQPRVDIFYSLAFFTLRFFTNILTCVYQGFLGSRQFLEVCRASY